LFHLLTFVAGGAKAESTIAKARDANAVSTIPLMDSNDNTLTNNPLPAAPPLPADDPRSAENIARRKALGIAERDPKTGQLYPGSVLTRAGRPPGPVITTMARQHTEKAIETLAAVMTDTKAQPAARVAAAQALLDRGWGKAPVQIDLNVRAKFDNFLREVGAAALYEREHPDCEALVGEDV
jgi:hypothetical protein